MLEIGFKRIGPAFLPIGNSLCEFKEEYFSGRNFVEGKPNIKLYNLVKSVTVNLLIYRIFAPES